MMDHRMKNTFAVMHAVAPHTRKYREALHPLAGSPIDKRTYRSVT